MKKLFELPTARILLRLASIHSPADSTRTGARLSSATRDCKPCSASTYTAESRPAVHDAVGVRTRIVSSGEQEDSKTTGQARCAMGFRTHRREPPHVPARPLFPRPERRRAGRALSIVQRGAPAALSRQVQADRAQ